MRISANGSREVGIFGSSSAVKLVAVPVALVSTIGDSPMTVIVSATVATFSATGSSTLLPTATTTFSRTTVVKPCSAGRDLVRARREVEEAVFAAALGDERLGGVERPVR